MPQGERHESQVWAVAMEEDSRVRKPWHFILATSLPGQHFLQGEAASSLKETIRVCSLHSGRKYCQFQGCMVLASLNK